jgi:class 3 adenylate cyclase
MVVLFDRRGVGGSQREVDDVSLEVQVADLTAVIDALRLERFDLMGVEDGAAVAVTYAAQHPERVSRLVLWAPIVLGEDVTTPEAARSLADLMRTSWSLARRALADMVFPNGPIEWQLWLSDYFREAASREVAAKYLEIMLAVDARAFAAEVNAPTLILHRRGQRTVPARAIRGAAAVIPGARLIVLEGDAAMIYFDHVPVVSHVKEFLDEGVDRAAAAPSGVADVHTILFTDMESSTALRQRQGDAKAQELVRVHNTIVREALAAQDGSEIKHTGDGIMASFAAASQALQSAIAIQRGVAAHVEEQPDAALRVYIGMNAGEPIVEEGPDGRADLYGTSVDLAKRICDQCQPGEILVSDVVRQLAAGKEFLFSDRGETALRGFEDPVRLYEVRWREEG